MLSNRDQIESSQTTLDADESKLPALRSPTTMVDCRLCGAISKVFSQTWSLSCAALTILSFACSHYHSPSTLLH